MCIQINNVIREIKHGNDKCWQIEGAFNREPARPNANVCISSDPTHRRCMAMVGFLCEDHSSGATAPVTRFMQITGLNLESEFQGGGRAIEIQADPQTGWSQIIIADTYPPSLPGQWKLTRAASNEQCRTIPNVE
jgi:hypothetical protein